MHIVPRQLSRYLVPLLVAAALVASAACGDDGGGDVVLTVTPSVAAPSPSPMPATPTPDAAATPQTTPDLGDIPSSGVLSVDRAIDVVMRGDQLTLRSLVRFTTLACAGGPPAGIGGPPRCRDGEAAGTEVQAFPFAQCEAQYARPDEIDISRWPVADAVFYAAYRVPTGAYPPGPYAVVFRRAGGMADGLAWALVLSDDGIVGANFGCGDTPASLIAGLRLTDTLIPAQ